MRALGRTAAAFLAALGLAFGSPASAESVLRVSMHSDLKIIDPIWTTALISADHGYLVYDTLFALDETLTIKPQMVETWATSPDRLTWTFTLRAGLEWHDGAKVTAADCVASIRRWGARDSMGQMLMSFTGELAAPDDKTIRLVLKEPYGLVLQALGKTGANVPFMMPRRVAETSPNSQINDATGSGPFIFKKDEWKAGEKAVYLKNPTYKPRNEPPSGFAGGKSIRVTLASHHQMRSIAADAVYLLRRADCGHKDSRQFSELHRRKSNRGSVVSSRGGNHTCRRHLTREQIGESTPRLKRTGMLEQFQLEHEIGGFQSKVRACHFHDGCAPDVLAYELVYRDDAFSSDLGSGHGVQFPMTAAGWTGL